MKQNSSDPVVDLVAILRASEPSNWDVATTDVRHPGAWRVVSLSLLVALMTLCLTTAISGQNLPPVDSLTSSPSGTADPIRITTRPTELLFGQFSLGVSISEPAVKARLYINGIRHSLQEGPSAVFQLKPGMYVRRFRYRVEGLDAEGNVVGQDEITVNDPRPPFRVRVLAPPGLPEKGMVTLNASVTSPRENPPRAVEFFLGETSLGSDSTPPFSVSFNAGYFDPLPPYVRGVAIARDGQEANDVLFFSDRLTENVDVIVQEIPVSVKGSLTRDLTLADLELVDSGIETKIDSVVPARNLPLNVVLLLDSSESMLEEIPVLKEAASGFARSILDGRNRIAVVAFTERVWWLTGFTRSQKVVDASLERLSPRGETHLYDTTIEMLYELQKMPGRRALVVLTDGVNQGGDFEVEHVVHYARYSGVPIYPIIQNSLLSKLRHIPLAKFDAEKYAEIADDAGASYFIVKKQKELPSVYEAIANELNNQYLIRFRVETAGRDLWRPIRLTTNREDVTLRTPRGYFP